MRLDEAWPNDTTTKMVGDKNILLITNTRRDALVAALAGNKSVEFGYQCDGIQFVDSLPPHQSTV